MPKKKTEKREYKPGEKIAIAVKIASLRVRENNKDLSLLKAVRGCSEGALNLIDDNIHGYNLLIQLAKDNKEKLDDLDVEEIRKIFRGFFTDIDIDEYWEDLGKERHRPPKLPKNMKEKEYLDIPSLLDKFNGPRNLTEWFIYR